MIDISDTTCYLEVFKKEGKTDFKIQETGCGGGGSGDDRGPSVVRWEKKTLKGKNFKV